MNPILGKGEFTRSPNSGRIVTLGASPPSVHPLGHRDTSLADAARIPMGVTGELGELADVGSLDSATEHSRFPVKPILMFQSPFQLQRFLA